MPSAALKIALVHAQSAPLMATSALQYYHDSLPPWAEGDPVRHGPNAGTADDMSCQSQNVSIAHLGSNQEFQQPAEILRCLALAI